MLGRRTTASTPAAQFLDDSDSVIRGKAALRAYWAEGLRRIPDPHFEVVGVYVGVHTLAISYRNQLGRLANEILIVDGSLVTQGHGTYLGSSATPAGVTPLGANPAGLTPLEFMSCHTMPPQLEKPAA